MTSRYSIQAVIRYFIGILICGLGISVIFAANLGSAATTTFSEGLSILLNTQIGTANVIMNIMIFTIVIIFDRKNIGLGTILSTFSFGLSINIWTPIISSLIKIDNIWIRILVSLIGIIIEAYGLSYYMRAELGYGSLELLAEIISKRLKVTFAIAKQSVDFTFMLVGYLLGGAVGIGTVMATFLMGYLVDKNLQKGRKNEKV